MINILKLKNFQKHESLTLEFEPGVNVIIGSTNSGKSAIIRAIRWLVEHRAISGLPTHGTDNTRVGIVTNGNVVVRFKDKTGYGYKINDKPPYLATGSVQPVAVKQVLGIEPINFQGQHDPPFLLSLTPGQMAKELNKIVDLGSIDEANGYLAGILSKTKSEIEVYKKDLEKYGQELAKVAWSERAIAALDEIDAAQAALVAQQEKRDEIHRVMIGCGKAYANIALIDRQIQRLDELYKIAIGVAETQDTYRKLKSVVDGIENLQDFGPVIKALEPIVSVALVLQERKQNRAALYSVLTEIEQIQAKLSKPVPDVEEVRERLEKYLDRTWNHINMTTILEKIENLSDRLDVTDFKIEQLEAQISEVPICPTCKKPL